MLTKNVLEEFKLECELRRLSHRTIKGYYNNVQATLVYLEKEFGVTEIEKIGTIHLKKYVNYLNQRKLTPSYINSIIKCLRAFFQFCIAEELIAVNPVLRVNWQREGKVIINTFRDDEVKDLLAAFGTTTFLDCRNKLILAIAFDTGARNTEICNICNKDVKKNVILIHGKGNKERNVPITPYIKKLMLKYQHVKGFYFSNKILKYDNLLLSRTGRPLTKEALEHIFNQANEKANIRKDIRCSPHTARHYYAQSNIRNGLDVYSLSRLLGHENINITKRYLQSITDEDIVNMAVDSSPLSNLKIK